MKTTKLLLAASIAAASLGAMAATQEGSPAADANAAQSTLSRVQVQSELTAFKKAGVNPWSTTYNPASQFRSERSRADVSAEYVALRDQVAAMTREDSGSAYLMQAAARPHGASFAGR